MQQVPCKLQLRQDAAIQGFQGPTCRKFSDQSVAILAPKLVQISDSSMHILVPKCCK